MRQPGTPEQEMQGFSQRVHSLLEAGQPVKIQVGFGWTPVAGFINLDIAPMLEAADHRLDGKDIFYFPYADEPWPIPSGCVDYIYHEDFIEHVTQKQQVCFLAEALRVLRHGSWHRVNTPCLIASMRRHSRFEEGMKGVYVGEWNNWQHISLFTRHSLEEMARLVGYRDVVFNLKNHGVSPFRLDKEVRPGPDRDALSGNIYADLLKLDRPAHAKLDLRAMLEWFDEAFYLKSNQDVAEAVRAGWFKSGRDHYTACGFTERRLAFAIDTTWYAEQYPLAAMEVAYGDYADFGQHFVAIGQSRGYRPAPRGW
jgi:predicted SAM-dependent methyltransferase